MLIGEIATATGVTTKTLRFYEAEGLLHEPRRTSGGYRDYPPETVNRIRFVRHAQAAGLTLRQIGEILSIRDGGQAPCRHVGELVDHRLAEIEERLRDLSHTRAQLLQLKQRVAVLDPTECPPSAICTAVRQP